MIYTCTINPSLDYFMEYDHDLTIGSGHINRSVLEYYEAGGKGVNCSIVLNNMGVPSRAFGFLGGFTRDFYISLLSKYELIEPRFTDIDGNTRINVKITGHQCIECNAVGPYVTDSAFDRFEKKALRLMDSDTLIFSGTCHDYLLDRIEPMFQKLHDEGVRLCVDSGHAINDIAKRIGAFLVLLNEHEASSYFKCNDDEDELVKAAIKWKPDNVKFVILTFDKNRSILITDKEVYKADSIELPKERINGVGFDDSIMAGFMMNILRSPDIIESFQFANSCGQATLFSKGMATKEHINSVYEKIKVDKIDI